MKRGMAAAAIALAASMIGLASPATACLRTLEVPFEADAAQVADTKAVSGFVDVATYGIRQRIIVRVAAPDHDLALRRAATLSDLLQANGLMASGIQIETETKPMERAILLIFPGPVIRPDPRLAQAAPAPTPAPPRKTCGG